MKNVATIAVFIGLPILSLGLSRYQIFSTQLSGPKQFKTVKIFNRSERGDGAFLVWENTSTQAVR